MSSISSISVVGNLSECFISSNLDEYSLDKSAICSVIANSFAVSTLTLLI